MNVGGKGSFEASAWSSFLILTPGGGGYGNRDERQEKEGNEDLDVGVVGGSLNKFKKMQEQC